MKQSIIHLQKMALILTITTTLLCNAQSINNTKNHTIMSNKTMMNELIQNKTATTDHSNKSILARGCDPALSLQFSKIVPPLIGNAQYVPTTDDVTFIEQLKSKKWSVVFFAPGACRWSAAKQPIPGGNYDTKNWDLEQYKALVYELQGNGVQIVETPYEQEVIPLLQKSLKTARETK